MDRLSTKSRLVRHSADLDANCLFCGMEETRDHLFFGCYSSLQIWQAATFQLKSSIPSDWPLVIEWGIRALRRSTVMSTVIKLIFEVAFTIFGWREMQGFSVDCLDPLPL